MMSLNTITFTIQQTVIFPQNFASAKLQKPLTLNAYNRSRFLRVVNFSIAILQVSPLNYENIGQRDSMSCHGNSIEWNVKTTWWNEATE